jgi:hypothetical protein
LADLEIVSVDRFKLCLFIDGLDEYEGDSEAVLGLFDRLSRSSHIKVCLSSRPWLVFEESLGHHPGLRLQDLTYNDIRTFVQDKLDANPKMLQLIKSNPLEGVEFSKAIVAKAKSFRYLTLRRTLHYSSRHWNWNLLYQPLLRLWKL